MNPTTEQLPPDDTPRPPASSPDDRLARVAADLERRGLFSDARELRELQSELDAVERPPGLFRRAGASVRGVARRQWTFLVNEIRESGEAWSLLKRRVVAREALTEEETDALRAQLLDVFRCVPAGVLTAASLVAPVPGVALASPWLLRRLGLLPSSWREAHLLDRLQKEHDDLVALGELAAAENVEAVLHDVEDRARERDRLARECPLLLHWDADGNGVIDAAEQTAYDETVTRLQALSGGPRRRWFLRLGDGIFGPLRWSELPELDDEPDALTSDGSGWVRLSDVRSSAK